MNFLSPDDIFSGVRRKSLCNGALLTLSNKNNNNNNNNNNTTLNNNNNNNSHSSTCEQVVGGSLSNKSKKERRRGSFNETSTRAATVAPEGRRASLVSRWFKHITDAAEQYKRSKHATTEIVDDPTIVTIPHSSAKDALELTSERPAAMAATATVTITPLAPMIPPPTVTAVATTYITPSHNNNNNNSNYNHHHNGSNDSLGGVQLRNNGRRESTPIYSMPPPSQHAGSPLPTKSMRHSHNELTPGSSTNLSINSTSSASSLAPVVNRTMSTRSCGAVESPDNSPPSSTGVTLRHTQSARQATAQDAADMGESRRDSNSIVYAHNPNNTRTLLQTAPPLIDPSAVQISITPVHICETPAERLRRLDGNIREGLLEKQRIICDMFRLPVEHFHEIVDIAAMPEAPKDTADIALAAYAQVQSLTEVLNEYLQITPAQESAAISAASTNGCAQCHDKQAPPRPPYPNGSTSSSSSITPVTVSERSSPSSSMPPPLPPPNKQQPAGQTATPNSMPKLQTPTIGSLENATHIHEDDDGYCEIDELRLPAIPTTIATAMNKTKMSPPPPLPPPMGSCKAAAPPPPPPPPPATSTPTPSTPANSANELTKRQSTISADSIPEESAEDITRALADESHDSVNNNDTDKANESNDQTSTMIGDIDEGDDETAEEKSDETKQTVDGEITIENAETDQTEGDNNIEKEKVDEKCETTDQIEQKEIEQKEVVTKPVLVDVDTQTTLSLCPNNVVNTNTTTIITIGSNSNNSTGAMATYENCSHNSTLNGPIRIQHANNNEPSVPCHALASIVCALNTHISLLLPTINERDMERERLRKENQRLRELVNAMQRERPRVESKMETPTDITLNSVVAGDSTKPTATSDATSAVDECDGPAVPSTSTDAPLTVAENNEENAADDIIEKTTTTTTTTVSEPTSNNNSNTTADTSASEIKDLH